MRRGKSEVLSSLPRLRKNAMANPDTVVQVAAYKDLARAVREKLPECEVQRVRAGATFCALFCRRPGGRYVVVLSPEGWATLWREAMA